MNETKEISSNVGHGHVFLRPDKARARCGGPRMCQKCQADLAELQRQASGSTSADTLDKAISDSPIDIEIDGFDIVLDDIHWLSESDAEYLASALQAAAQKLRIIRHAGGVR